jgi:hypothetical protein
VPPNACEFEREQTEVTTPHHRANFPHLRATYARDPRRDCARACVCVCVTSDVFTVLKHSYYYREKEGRSSERRKRAKQKTGARSRGGIAPRPLTGCLAGTWPEAQANGGGASRGAPVFFSLSLSLSAARGRAHTHTRARHPPAFRRKRSARANTAGGGVGARGGVGTGGTAGGVRGPARQNNQKTNGAQARMLATRLLGLDCERKEGGRVMKRKGTRGVGVGCALSFSLSLFGGGRRGRGALSWGCGVVVVEMEAGG